MIKVNLARSVLKLKHFSIGLTSIWEQVALEFGEGRNATFPEVRATLDQKQSAGPIHWTGGCYARDRLHIIDVQTTRAFLKLLKHQHPNRHGVFLVSVTDNPDHTRLSFGLKELVLRK